MVNKDEYISLSCQPKCLVSESSAKSCQRTGVSAKRPVILLNYL